MPWVEIAADLDVLFADSEEPIVYRRRDGGDLAMAAIINRGFGDGGGLQDCRVSALIRCTDLPADPRTENHGDVLIAGGIAYAVRTAERDQIGAIWRLGLQQRSS